MYRSIKIEGFRQFDNFEIDDLGAINLFIGENNTGKSSLLEAFYTLANGLNFNNFNQKIICKNLSNNPLEAANLIRALFYSTKSNPYKFIISAKTTPTGKTNCIYETFNKVKSVFKPSAFIASIFNLEAKHYFDPLFLKDYKDSYLGSFEISEKKYTFNSIKIDYNYPLVIDNNLQFCPAVLQDVLDHRHSNTDVTVFYRLKQHNILKDFITEIKKVFPIIKDIDYIPYPNGNKSPVLLVTTNNKILPFYTFGDGLKRWYHILGNLITVQNTIHCIEEIDATFHPKAQNRLGSLLLRYAKKYNNQIMLTSHSLEFANSFLSSLYKYKNNELIKGEDPVRIFTLAKDENDRFEVWKYTGKEAFEMLSKHNMELI